MIGGKCTGEFVSCKDDEMLFMEIVNAIKSIRYGYVHIIIQNSKIVQIDKTEKIRLDAEIGRTKGGGRL